MKIQTSRIMLCALLLFGALGGCASVVRYDSNPPPRDQNDPCTPLPAMSGSISVNPQRGWRKAGYNGCATDDAYECATPESCGPLEVRLTPSPEMRGGVVDAGVTALTGCFRVFAGDAEWFGVHDPAKEAETMPRFEASTKPRRWSAKVKIPPVNGVVVAVQPVAGCGPVLIGRAGFKP